MELPRPLHRSPTRTAAETRPPGSGTGLAAKGVELVAEYLPYLLVVTTILATSDVFRTVQARRKADAHIATPGRPKLPGA